MFYSRALIFLVVPAAVLAWGKDGHQLTGALAQKLLSASGFATVKKLLPSDWQGDMARATTWADEVKRAKGYAGWSGVLHYVDVEGGHPPKDCKGYVESRDCPDGNCIVGAIANYTGRLSCSLGAEVRSEAAKFLTHFIGDITQPLHVCGRDKGGNGAKATFDRKTSSNLHSIWDTDILVKRMKEKSQGSQAKYLDYLLTEVKSTMKADAAKWVSCFGGSAKPDAKMARACAAEWANDSEGINCDAVWPAFEEDPRQNFGGAYYTQAYPIVERQIMKAGVRMAKLFEVFGKDCGDSAGASQDNDYVLSKRDLARNAAILHEAHLAKRDNVFMNSGVLHEPRFSRKPVRA